MIFASGCGNDGVKNESSDNQNEAVANSSVEKPYQPRQGEIFVGHSDYNGKDCYLLENSIRQNNDKSVDCKIKMVTSATNVEYLEYKFYGKGTMDFTTNAGFSSTADKYSTPIEYNIYETLTQYVDMSQIDNTLHITLEEFMRRYNNNISIYFDGNDIASNKFKINGIKTEGYKEGSISYDFQNNSTVKIGAIVNKDEKNINRLIIIREYRRGEEDFFLGMMSLAVYSIYNKNPISSSAKDPPKDLIEMTSLIQSLMKQALKKDINTIKAEIIKNGVSVETATMNYQGNKLSFVTSTDRNNNIAILKIENENAQN